MRHAANLAVHMDMAQEVVGCDSLREPSCRFANRPQEKDRSSVHRSVEPPVSMWQLNFFDAPDGFYQTSRHGYDASGLSRAAEVCRISRFDESQPCGGGPERYGFGLLEMRGRWVKRARAHKMLAWHVAEERIVYRRVGTSIAMRGARRSGLRRIVNGTERLQPYRELLVVSRALLGGRVTELCFDLETASSFVAGRDLFGQPASQDPKAAAARPVHFATARRG